MIDPAALLEEFRAEAADHLRVLDAELLRLERSSSDPEPVRRMFLSAHTIKGGAGMVGLTQVRELAHAVEGVLAYLRDQRGMLDTDMADLLFRAVDALRDLLAQGEAPDAAAGTAQLVAALGQYATGKPVGPPPTVSRPAPRPGGPRALVVDDSPTVRMLEEMLLSDAGFAVDAVDSGSEALGRLLGESYDLLVTAIQTRGASGLEVVATLRSSPAGRDIPVILMSSDDNPEHLQRAVELGVWDYIRKGSLGQRRLTEAALEVLERRGR